MPKKIFGSKFWLSFNSIKAAVRQAIKPPIAYIPLEILFKLAEPFLSTLLDYAIRASDVASHHVIHIYEITTHTKIKYFPYIIPHIIITIIESAFIVEFTIK